MLVHFCLQCHHIGVGLISHRVVNHITGVTFPLAVGAQRVMFEPFINGVGLLEGLDHFLVRGGFRGSKGGQGSSQHHEAGQ